VIGVLLVDDHKMVLAGLAGLVDQAEGMHVVGLASDGLQALEVAGRTSPDVVVMDLSMPVLDGIEAITRLMQQQPGARVLVLTSFSDRERILRAVQAGAAGYLLKDSAPDDLLSGIRAVARGESPLDGRVAREVLAGHTGAPGQDPPPSRTAADLTHREREVLLLLREGLANKQIAGRLGITASTVKTHLSSAFHRIGVNDRTSAALYAQRHLLDGPPG
jgi:DNA-binding NarL/FixJ family response regulator